MTTDFIDMLRLFAMGATGKRVSFDHKLNIDRIRVLAIRQSVWQTVFTALSELECKNDIENYDKLKSEVMISISDSIRRNTFTERVLKQIEENGIRLCVLKGVTVARLYAHPDCRVSSDVDILIDSRDEEKCTDLLRSLGYQVEEHGNVAHHFGARHTVGGLLEIHTSMYYRTTADILLEGLVSYDEPYIDIGGLNSLGINDGLMFLTVHLLKHFLNGAAGLRQISDLLIYMDHYNSQIDWEKYYALMKKLKYDGMIATICGVGNLYFGFSFVGADMTMVDEFLEDTEYGGNFGRNNAEILAGFYHIFAKKRASMRSHEFEKYFDKNTRGTKLQRMFPPLLAMKKEYKVLEKHSGLLPAAWVCRLFEIAIRILKGERGFDSRPGEDNEILQKRLELTKKMGML